jgi:DNA-binding HxlR family transcriptional regulator
MKTPPSPCPAAVTLRVIGGRWKVPILWHLSKHEVRRFSELHRGLDGINQKMLTQQLRELELAGVVRRKVYAQVPPKVEYSLTEMGKSLMPIVSAMCKWGSSRKAKACHFS